MVGYEKRVNFMQTLNFTKQESVAIIASELLAFETKKSGFKQNYPFSQILSHNMITVYNVCLLFPI